MSDQDAKTDYPVFLPLDEVIRRTSLSRSTIHNMVAAGEFPKPIKVTPNRAAYVEAEIIAWQAAIISRCRTA